MKKKASNRIKLVSKKIYGKEYKYYLGARMDKLLCQPGYEVKLKKLSRKYVILPVARDELTGLYDWVIPCRYGQISEHPLGENWEDPASVVTLGFLSYSTAYSRKLAIKLGEDLLYRDVYDPGDEYKDLIVFPENRLKDVAKLVKAKTRRKVSKKRREQLKELLKKARAAKGKSE